VTAKASMGLSHVLLSRQAMKQSNKYFEVNVRGILKAERNRAVHLVLCIFQHIQCWCKFGDHGGWTQVRWSRWLNTLINYCSTESIATWLCSRKTRWLHIAAPSRTISSSVDLE